jgi:hypothetical protein
MDGFLFDGSGLAKPSASACIRRCSPRIAGMDADLTPCILLRMRPSPSLHSGRVKADPHAQDREG